MLKMTNTAEKHFDINHPTAAGHFPGHPIIPGAVLLDEVIQTIATSEKRRSWPFDLRSAKFLRPVRPGDRIVIRWDAGQGGETKFECLLLGSGEIALTGVIKIDGPIP